MIPDLLIKVLGDKWLRLMVTLLLLAVLAHQVSLLVWRFVPMQQTMAAAPRAESTRVTPSNDAGANFQQQANAISRAFLFGKAEVQTVEVVEVEEAPPTQLNYKLRGIYFSPEDRLSSAIIEIQPNKSQPYRIDDELDDKILLAGIEEDHVLINRYGKLERLNLQKREAPQIATGGLRSSASSAGQSALLRSYKKRYNSNPMALATRFQAIPVQKDGKNIGFKLKALRGESLLRKLDFQPNDVFTAVNGVDLRNPFEALDALKSLTTANSFSVTFLRNGSEQTLDFQL